MIQKVSKGRKTPAQQQQQLSSCATMGNPVEPERMSSIANRTTNFEIMTLIKSTNQSLRLEVDQVEPVLS